MQSCTIIRLDCSEHHTPFRSVQTPRSLTSKIIRPFFICIVSLELSSSVAFLPRTHHFRLLSFGLFPPTPFRSISPSQEVFLKNRVISHKRPRNQRFVNFLSHCLLQVFKLQNIGTLLCCSFCFKCGHQLSYFSFSDGEALGLSLKTGPWRPGSPGRLNGFERIREVATLLGRPHGGCNHFSFGFKSVQVKHNSGLIGILNQPHLQESRGVSLGEKPLPSDRSNKNQKCMQTWTGCLKESCSSLLVRTAVFRPAESFLGQRL